MPSFRTDPDFSRPTSSSSAVGLAPWRTAFVAAVCLAFFTPSRGQEAEATPPEPEAPAAAEVAGEDQPGPVGDAVEPTSPDPVVPGSPVDGVAPIILIEIDAPANPEAPDDGAAGDTPGSTEEAGFPAAALMIEDPLVSPLEDPPLALDLLSPEGSQPTPTENVVVNLIGRLVERGVLTQGDAAELVAQAQRDAAIANQNAAAAALLAADAAMATEEDIVVTHIPEPVKAQLRDEIRRDLIAERADMVMYVDAKNTAYVEELHAERQGRVRVFGDFRVRYDASRFPEGNDNTGSFPNFNRINTGDPFDVAGFEFSPQLNVDEDRRRFRMRARLGASAELGEGFSVVGRVATGNDGSPISTNQTLGNNFQKYSLWLDQAHLRWDGHGVHGSAGVLMGRFENPFFRTSEMMWDRDLNFDGLALNLKRDFNENASGFLTAGAFPIFSTSFDFPSNRPDKFESTDRYLLGAQTGVDLAFNRNVAGKFGLGYHDFSGVQGRLSDPFIPFTARDAGSTDGRRPTFAQKGNTYTPLRDIVPDPLNAFGTMNQFQYFGLASKFQILSYNQRIDLSFWEPFQVGLLGEFAVNLGYDEDQVSQIAVNNRGPLQEDGSTGDFEGGNVAWNMGVQFGKAVFEQRGDWNALLGYRFVESDSVMDAFNDSDFGLGGTNMEGFTVGTGIALNSKVQLNFRWMGASEISGPPLKSDVFQFDINAKF